MRRIVLTFGLLAGALLASWILVGFLFTDIGLRGGQTLGYASMVLAFLFVFFGIRSYRDTVGGGTVGFSRAAKVGLLITLTASACYVATWLVYYYGFAPDFMDRYAARALADARAAGASAEQLAAQARQMARFRELYANPFINAAITFLEVFPVGLIMTLVSAGILRRGARPSGSAARVGSASALA